MAGRLECLGRHPGSLEVDRRVNLRRPFQVLAELGGASVKAPALALGQAPVEGVAQQLVAKVEEPTQSGRVEDVLVDEFAQRLVEGIRGHVQDARENLRHEATADHRPGSGDRLRFRREPADALEDRVFEGVRHRGVADGAAVSALVLGDRPQQFLDVEWNAIGSLVDGRDHVPWPGQAGAEHQGRH